MLSTPPAFNLSQNQTLQFKSVAKISVGRKSESQSSFPFAIHLSMNHTDSLGAKQLFTPLRFRCQQVFSFSRKFFFRGPVGATRWREGDLCLIFKPASRTFFAIRENFFSRRPFGRGQLVGANGFMRLFDPTVKYFSAKNFTDLLHADCLFNQHTEKTQEILDKFLCLFLFALLLFLPIESLSSPLRPESAPIFFRSTGFLQILRGCPACFLILKGVVISSHETNRFS